MTANKVLRTKDEVLAHITATFTEEELKNLIFVNSTALMLVAPQVAKETIRIQALAVNRETFDAMLKRFNYVGEIVTKNGRLYADLNDDFQLRLSTFCNLRIVLTDDVSNLRFVIKVSDRIYSQSPHDLRITYTIRSRKKPKNQYLRMVSEALHQLVPLVSPQDLFTISENIEKIRRKNHPFDPMLDDHTPKEDQE